MISSCLQLIAFSKSLKLQAKMENHQNAYYSPYFQYRNGLLHCEDRNSREITEWLRNKDVYPYSPVYIYSKNKIVRNVEGYKEPLTKTKMDFQLNYSVKANMNPHILSIMKDLGCSVTLVSGMELQLALRLGFQPNSIVLNGNGKQLWEIELAIHHGSILNIDSEFNLTHTLEACSRLGKDARVFLRVNPDIDPAVHHYINTGKKGSKFGLGVGSLNNILHDIKQHSQLHLVGLHCHLGSTIEKPQVFRESAEIMLELYRKLKSDGFNEMKYLNLGGGLSIPYRQHAWRTTRRNNGIDRMEDLQDILSVESPYKRIFKNGIIRRDEEKIEQDRPEFACAEDIIAAIYEVVKDDDITLILEPGRSLIADAGILLTTVLGVKNNGDKNYIVVDGAMTEVLRPALYGAYHHIDLAEPSLSPDTHSLFDIVGPVCESADFLGKDRYLQTPHEGCLLAVFDVGAYCSSMGSNYNFRPRPAEVLIDGKNCDLIRRPDSFEALMTPYLSTKNCTEVTKKEQYFLQNRREFPCD